MKLCILETEKQNLSNSVVLSQKNGVAQVLGQLVLLNNDINLETYLELGHDSEPLVTKPGANTQVFAKEIFVRAGKYFTVERNSRVYFSEEENQVIDKFIEKLNLMNELIGL